MSQTNFGALPSSPTPVTKLGRFGFRYTFVSNTLLQPLIDNEPNHRLKVENVGSSAKINVTVSYTGLNADSSVPTLSGGGFAVFPNGGNVNLAKGDTTVVQGWSSGWRECSCVNDGSNSKKVRFIFSYDSTFYGPDGLPDGTVTLKDTVIQSIAIVQRSQTQLQDLGVFMTTPTQTISGTFIIPGYIKTTTTLSTVNLATNGNSIRIYTTPTTSSYVSQTDSIGNRYVNFSVRVDARSDYRVEATFTSTNTSLLVPITTIVVPSNATVSGLQTTVMPYGKAGFTIDSVKTYETDAGFWRTVFAAGDSTITVFPGQENWFGASNTERTANRAKSKIIKFKVDNTNYGVKAWEYALPTEAWGGAVSKDGKVVAYMIKQRGVESGLENNVSVDWVGVLDGTTGVKKWGLRGDQNLQDGLEIGVSSKGDYIALGSAGYGRVTLYRNTGNAGSLMWSNPVDFTGDTSFLGQVRKIVFSDDDTYLYAGCGDMYLRKYKVSDGSLIWKTYIGGWPFVNGIAIANGYIITGTKSRDRTVIRDSDGSVVYFAETMGYDVETDSTFSGPAVGFGNLATNSTSGRVVASIGGNAVKHSILNGAFILMGDRGVDVYTRYGGNSLATRNTYMGTGSGEQSQSGWASSTGDRMIVTARDLVTGTFPRKTVAFYRITRNINRYPTMDSIGNKTMNPGDTIRVKIGYRDFNDYTTANILLSITATPDTSGLKTIIRGDSLIIYNAAGYAGTGKISIAVSETSTTEKFVVSELISVRVICNAPAVPTTSTSSYTYCKGATATALSATPASGTSLVWYTVSSGGTSSSSAPTPSTSSAGSVTYYAASSNNGCESATRLQISVLVNATPAAPTVTAVTTCSSSNTSALSATALTGNTLNWYGTNATGGTAATASPTVSNATAGVTDYYVSQVTTATGCEGPRAKLTYTINETPAKPTITKDINNNLVSSSTYNNSWYKDATLLSDTTQQIKPSSSGNYYVKVTKNGCSSPLSDANAYVVTAIINYSNDESIKIYPNPVRQQLKIDFKINGQTQLKLTMYDLNGKLVFSKEKIANGDLIDLSSISTGNYFIRLIYANGKILFTDKVMKL